MFRTADATGVEKIFLLGYTPTPIDRFGRVQTEVEKTSLGASAYIPWEYHAEMSMVVPLLKAAQCSLVAIEQKAEAVSLADFLPPKRVAYLLGHEIDGVSADGLTAADTIVEIPMLGTKESLNVSVAAGVVLYHDVVSQTVS